MSPSLVKRQKTHFHDLPCGASVILGNNGFVWIYPTPEHKDDEAGGFVANLEVRERGGPARPGPCSLGSDPWCAYWHLELNLATDLILVARPQIRGLWACG